MTQLIFSRTLISLNIASLLYIIGCDRQVDADSAALVASSTAHESELSRAGQPAPALVDSPLPQYQVELLDLAFRAASAIPAQPHVKTRSREQEAVVTACLELDQPHRALVYLENIANWRRGVCYAALSLSLARHGFDDLSRQYATLASVHASNAEDDWRRDRISVRIAQTHAWLGDSANAARLEAGVVDSEAGRVDAVRAQRLAHDDLEPFMQQLDDVIATGNFDRTRNALEAYAQLFDRCYADAGERVSILDKITGAWGTLPIALRLDLMSSLITSALAHHDRKAALRLLDESQSMLGAARLTPEMRVPAMARLAQQRFLAGDIDAAALEIEEARAHFAQNRDAIVNIYRADALRPVAEALHVMHDRAGASQVYAQAIEEGVANPNSTPRAEDLAATCRSMSLAGFEPDAALWSRLHTILEGLGAPW